MKTVAVLRHQTLFDIALQHCGDADYALDIATLNGLEMDTVVDRDDLVLSVPSVDTRTDRPLHPLSIVPLTGFDGSELDQSTDTRPVRLFDSLGQALRATNYESSNQNYISILRSSAGRAADASSQNATSTPASAELYAEPTNTL